MTTSITSIGANPVHKATLDAGEDQNNDVIKTEFQYGYQAIDASQTNLALGATGAAGDFLHAVVVTADDGTAIITIRDDTTLILAFSAAAGTLGTVYPLNIVSANGAFKVTTPANVTCTCIGRFT